MFDKFLKKDDSQDDTLKGMKAKVSGISQKIEPHSVAIKQLEQQSGSTT